MEDPHMAASRAMGGSSQSSSKLTLRSLTLRLEMLSTLPLHLGYQYLILLSLPSASTHKAQQLPTRQRIYQH